MRLQMAEGDHLAQPTSAKRLEPPHHTHRISAHVAQRALRLPTGGRFMRQHGWPLAPRGPPVSCARVHPCSGDPAAPWGRVATSRRPGHPSTVRCSPGLSSLAVRASKYMRLYSLPSTRRPCRERRCRAGKALPWNLRRNLRRRRKCMEVRMGEFGKLTAAAEAKTL